MNDEQVTDVVFYAYWLARAGGLQSSEWFVRATSRESAIARGFGAAKVLALKIAEGRSP